VTDAMDMFNAMRPPSPALGGDIRQSSSDLHNLAMVPGSPAYNQRIPKPPCWQCGEDHFPGRSYDHTWMAEPVQVHDEPVAASAVVRRPQVVEVPVAEHRVALYVGLGTRISDKTGGDLLMLEQDYEREHAQNHGRSAASDGDRGPRRPRLDPDGEEETLPDGANG